MESPKSPAPPISRDPLTHTLHGLKGHSCTLCGQRKVKCDRQDPCSNCVKARVQCVYRPSARPRRRRHESGKTPEAGLIAKLKHYEDLLRNHGVDIESTGQGVPLPGITNVDDGTGDSSESTKQERDSGLNGGRFISEHGNTRYIENHLWTSLYDEVRDSRKLFQGASGQESGDVSSACRTNGSNLVMCSEPMPTPLTTLHPQPVHIFRLWQVFLDNVNPLVKLLHAPTVQPLILEATGSLEKVSKSLEALMFAIYASAVNSMSEGDCEGMIGETKASLLARYQHCAQQALTRAEILRTSDLTVLQAYVLFLLSVRSSYDPCTLWSLTGVAARIGQRIGLHRDRSSTNLPILEAEIRRRLWWQIIILDHRTAELSGSDPSVQAQLWDVKLPLNVNDSDLSPDMRDAPMEHVGATEMVFCLIRYEFGDFRNSKLIQSVRSSESNKFLGFISNERTLPNKDKAIDEFESLLEHKYVRYCDPSIPLHFLSTWVVRSIICKMRWMAHHPRQYPDAGDAMPQEERDMLFLLCLEMIEYDAMARSTKSMQRFIWHLNVYFQLEAFVYMLSELRRYTAGELHDRAWQQIEQVFQNHGEFITDTDNTLYVALGNLTLKAWEAKEAHLRRRSRASSQIPQPQFITKLYSQRPAHKTVDYPTPSSTNSSFIRTAVHMDGRRPSQHKHESDEALMVHGGMSHGFDSSLPSDSSIVDSSPIDWSYWDHLLQGYDQQLLFDGSAQMNFDQT